MLVSLETMADPSAVPSMLLYGVLDLGMRPQALFAN